ncbi:MAG: hypothetical protein ACI9U2_005195 [Bradymonadia bacterium]|jgi:hypothetical protein
MRLPLWGLIPALLCVASPALAREVDGLAKALVSLRSEVEQLNDQVEEARRSGRDQRRALATQQTELDAERTRVGLRVAQIEETLNAKKQSVLAAKQAQTTLVPVFETAAARVRARIASSLPFKRAARLKAVDDLSRKLADGLLTPHLALSRLWAMAEDELRLAGDTGLFRDTITLPDGEMLVDVIRMGMVGLYYRTGDGRVGVVGRSGDAWQTRPVTDEASARQITALFDAFKKQIRIGHFEVPTMLLGDGT